MIENWMVPKAQVVTCVPQTTLPDVARLMIAHDIGSVVVLSDDEKACPVGFISKTDLIKTAYIDNDMKQCAEKVMSHRIVTVNNKSNKDAASKLCMEAKVHHLVVVDDDEHFVGLLSAFDIARETALDAKAWPYHRGFLTAVRERFDKNH